MATLILGRHSRVLLDPVSFAFMFKVLQGSLRSFKPGVSLKPAPLGVKHVSSASTSVYSVGDKRHGYTVKDVQNIPEISALAIKLSHDGTGAEHLHVAKEDPNNTFSVGFSTIPEDSTGVAHILEHTTLCGSQNYPVRDPFFCMLNRSLSNFMNAFTSNDWTMYPFSTQNLKDFNNLMSVYLDCTFFPLLRDFDFKQEGWRLEHVEVNDKESPIMFKGVVFNEMKGVYANPEYLYSEAIQNFLLPDTTYSVSSGGRPINILDLTIEQLKKFRSNFYHPSNAKFFTYGNFPLDNHLKAIHEGVLSKFEKKPPLTPYSTETVIWDEPASQHIQCSPDPSLPDPSKSSTFSMTYLLAPITERYECFILMVLCELLSEGPTSLFYKSLLDSGLGYKYSPSAGYQSETRQTYFSIGLQGIDPADITKVEDAILSTFEKASEVGFTEEQISSVIHQMELSLKFQEKNMGLKLATSLISSWVHDANPVDDLLVNDIISKFKNEVSNDFLKDKVRKYFLNNRHVLKLSMSPSESYEQTLKDAEEAKLTSFVSNLSEQAKRGVFEDGLALKAEQSKHQNVEVLPTVQLSDVAKEGNRTLVEKVRGDYPIFYHNEPSNGLVHLNISSNFGSLSDDLKMYIPFFSYAVTKMGAGEYDYTNLSQQFDLHTGRMSVASHIIAHHSSMEGYYEELLCCSYSTLANAPKMLSLWKDVLLRPHFANEQRLLHLLKDFSTSLAQSVTYHGHLYSMKLSSSTLTTSARACENLFGVTQVRFLQDLVKNGNVKELLDKLSSIASHVFRGENVRALWTGSPEDNDNLSEQLQEFMQTMGHKEPQRDFLTADPLFEAQTGNKVHIVLPSLVNYVSQSFKSVPYSHPDYPKLQLLAKLLNSKYLHKNIREIGGAYGSAAVQSDGVFSFGSYRDPNLENTLSVYEKANEWLLGSETSDRDIDEAKFRMFSQIDSPVYLQDKGMRWFMSRIDDDQVQLFRDQLLGVVRQDLMDVCEKYFVNPRNSSVIGPAQSEDSASSWTVSEF